MSVFDYENYKHFVVKTIESMPKKGRGQLTRLAKFINTSPVIVSQVFKGNREFTVEQAFDACDFFGLNELEKEYFLLLVQKNRAGHHRLKLHVEGKLSKIKKKSQNLKDRLVQAKDITEEAKARFYSNWYYSAITLLLLVPGDHTAESISEKLSLSLSKTREALLFLNEHGLVLLKGDRYFTGAQYTHLSKSSPYVPNHHKNWRIKGLEKIDGIGEYELFFTNPLSLSKKDIEYVYNELIKLIEGVNELAQKTKDEELICLNIDWFKY